MFIIYQFKKEISRKTFLTTIIYVTIMQSLILVLALLLLLTITTTATVYSV